MLLLLVPFIGRAQFVIGWSGGYASPHELNRTIYLFNTQYSDILRDEMKPVHWYQGLITGFRSSKDDGVFVELLYNRKRALVSGSYDSAGVEMVHELKVLSNTWNFGIGVKNGNVSLGMSFDAGRFKGKGRVGTASEIGSKEFERLWVQDNTILLGIHIFKLYMASTAFVEFTAGNFIGLRFYFQYAFTKNQMEGLDPWLLGRRINFADFMLDKFTSGGVALTLNIGGR